MVPAERTLVSGTVFSDVENPFPGHYAFLCALAALKQIPSFTALRAKSTRSYGATYAEDGELQMFRLGLIASVRKS